MYIVVMRQVSKTHAYKAKNKMHNLKGTRPHSRIGCACRPVSFSSCLNLVFIGIKEVESEIESASY